MYLEAKHNLLNEGFEFYIYNRWGDLIYEASGTFSDYQSALAVIGWDGRANFGEDIAQQDVYVWLVMAADTKGKKHQYLGHVTLIR